MIREKLPIYEALLHRTDYIGSSHLMIACQFDIGTSIFRQLLVEFKLIEELSESISIGGPVYLLCMHGRDKLLDTLVEVLDELDNKQLLKYFY